MESLIFKRNIYASLTVFVFVFEIAIAFHRYLNGYESSTHQLNSTILRIGHVLLFYGVKEFFIDYPRIKKAINIIIVLLVFFALHIWLSSFYDFSYMVLALKVMLTIATIVFYVEVFKKDKNEIKIKKHIRPYIVCEVVVLLVVYVLVELFEPQIKFGNPFVTPQYPPIYFFLSSILIVIPLPFLGYFFFEAAKRNNVF